MKLYVQHGYGGGSKAEQAFEAELAQGIIYSPRDIKKPNLKKEIADIRKSYNNIDILVDPQFFVSLYDQEPEIKKRFLDEWKCYKGYSKSHLELSENIDEILKSYFTEFIDIDTDYIISPNIYITHSLDSREAVISKNFIRRTRRIFSSFKDNRKVFASLIIDWQVLLDNNEFEAFLNDLTLLENGPDGFYLVIGADSINPQEEFFTEHIISSWMKLNYTLTVNGYEVINGFSDILTPFMGAVGGSAGATGWWSNLRYFTIERFVPTASGGRMPIKRYLSNLLLNRIKFDEKVAFEKIIPQIANDLPSDSYYQPEPENRDLEMLQSWEALHHSTINISFNDIEGNLKVLIEKLSAAEEAYTVLNSSSLSIDKKSNDNHIKKMRRAIKEFASWAEIKLE